MSWQFLVALRYLSSRHREKFISLISLISVAGIALGVASLIIVISVMSGFDEDLRSKIIGTYSHIEIVSEFGLFPSKELTANILKVKNVNSISYFLNTQALVRHGDSVTGILVKGIDPADETRVTKLGEYLKNGSIALSDNNIIIGSELADKLGVRLGDMISLIAPYSIDLKNIKSLSKFKVDTEAFKVSGIFKSGMYEYDVNLAYVSIPAAQALAGIGDGVVGGIAVKIDDAMEAADVKRALQVALGSGFDVRTWVEQNKNLISALKLEKTVMFIILMLIVMVACFNIAGTLIMTVLEKTRDIGILKALGASNINIMALFALQGVIIGVIGTFLGALLGAGVCYALKTYRFITLPKEIYYVDKLPVRMDIGEIQLIILLSIFISLIATLYPSYKASRLEPVEALRYE